MTNVLLSQLVEGDEINSRSGAARKEGIVQLAASIKDVGLILPLAVRMLPGTPERSAIGEEPIYEIIDGHRRFAALKKLKWSEPVPVNVIVSDNTMAAAQSLIANVERLPLHPVDQYEAVLRLTDEGWSSDRVMRTFNLTDLQLRRILALAKMSDKVRKAWKDDKLTRDVAQMFTLTTDKKLQDSALSKLLKGSIQKYQLRAELVNGERNYGALVQFVGPDRLAAAGVQVVEDLFAERTEDRWLLVGDRDTINNVRDQKIEETIATLGAEGFDVEHGADDNAEYEDCLMLPSFQDEANDEETVLEYFARLDKEKAAGLTWIFDFGYHGPTIEGPYTKTVVRDEAAADDDDATEPQGRVLPAIAAPKKPDGMTNALRTDVIEWRCAAYRAAFVNDGKAFLRVMLKASAQHFFPGFNPSRNTEKPTELTDVWQYDSSVMMADLMATRYASWIDAHGDQAAQQLAHLLANGIHLRIQLLKVFIDHADEYFERSNMTAIRKALEEMGCNDLPGDTKKAALAKHAARMALCKEWLPELMRVGLDVTTEPFVENDDAEDDARDADPDYEGRDAAIAEAAYDHADLA